MSSFFNEGSRNDMVPVRSESLPSTRPSNQARNGASSAAATSTSMSSTVVTPSALRRTVIGETWATRVHALSSPPTANR